MDRDQRATADRAHFRRTRQEVVGETVFAEAQKASEK
jgi:hypothetical protein